MAATKKPKLNREQTRAAKRYTRQRKLYVITFEDEDKADLEIRARGLSFGDYIDLVPLMGVLDGNDDLSNLSAEDAGALVGLMEGFGDALVSWNLDEEVLDADGVPTGEVRPVPATVDGVRAQDPDFMMEIIGAWFVHMGGVDGPLDPGSNGGGRSLEASLPMAPSSPSPAS